MEASNYRHLLIGTAAPSTLEHFDQAARVHARALVDKINAKYARWWLTRFQMHRDPDVFVGWMTEPERAFDIVAALHVICWPVRFHFRLDGALALPSSEQARMQAESLPLDVLLSATEQAVARDVPLQFRVMAHHLEPYQTAAEVLGRAYVQRTRDWTPRQHQVVQRARALEGAAAVARELGVARQSVHRILRAAKADELGPIEDALRDWITLAVHDQGLRRLRRPALRLV